MLGSAEVISFVATDNPAAAREFYAETLGLRLVADEEFALVFDANGTSLRVQKVRDHTPLPYTALGWKVSNIEDAVSRLRAKGVRFERFPWHPQDESGVWATPDGAKVAWFKDPDGNLLSLTEPSKTAAPRATA